MAADGGDVETHLYHRFGEDALKVIAIINNDASLGEPMIEGLPYLGAEFIFSARDARCDDVARRSPHPANESAPPRRPRHAECGARDRHAGRGRALVER